MILSPRDREMCRLLLQGCDNGEIGKQLGVKTRTVKAHFNKMFFRFGIRDGVKRIKLAIMLYRRSSEWFNVGPDRGMLQLASNESFNSLQTDSKTGRSPSSSEPLKTWSKTTSASSTTKLESGIALNLLYGMKREIRALAQSVEALERARKLDKTIPARVRRIERKLSRLAA